MSKKSNSFKNIIMLSVALLLSAFLLISPTTSIPGSAANLKAYLTIGDNPTLTAVVTDSNGNGVSGVVVTINVTGGSADFGGGITTAIRTTDSGGIARMTVVNGTVPDAFSVSATGLGTVTLTSGYASNADINDIMVSWFNVSSNTIFGAVIHDDSKVLVLNSNITNITVTNVPGGKTTLQSADYPFSGIVNFTFTQQTTSSAAYMVIEQGFVDANDTVRFNDTSPGDYVTAEPTITLTTGNTDANKSSVNQSYPPAVPSQIGGNTTVKITVNDSNNNPIVNATVNVTSSRPSVDVINGINTSNRTNQFGEVFFNLTSNAIGISNYYYSANAGAGAVNLTNYTQIDFAYAISANDTNNGSGQIQVVNTSLTSPLVFVVKDYIGTPTGGAEVYFYAYYPNGTRAPNSSITSIDGGTDCASNCGGQVVQTQSTGQGAGNGTVNVSFRLGTVTGQYAVRGFINATPSKTANITAIATNDELNVSLSTITATPAGNVPADNTSFFTITVTVRDNFSNPVNNATVNITSNRGTTERIVNVSNVTTTNLTTGAGGTATFSVYSTTTGTATITAEANSTTLPNTVSITFGNALADPVKSSINVVVDNVNADGTTNATFQVITKDSAGNVVGNVYVVPSSNRSESIISPVNGTTNSSGIAVFNITSTRGGVTAINASINSINVSTPGLVNFYPVVNVSASVSNITIVTQRSIPADNNSTGTINVTVSDRLGYAIQGALVNVYSNKGYDTIAPANATIGNVTDASGNATFTIKSNNASYDIIPQKHLINATANYVANGLGARTLNDTKNITFAGKPNQSIDAVIAPSPANPNGTNVYVTLQINLTNTSGLKYSNSDTSNINVLYDSGVDEIFADNDSDGKYTAQADTFVDGNGSGGIDAGERNSSITNGTVLKPFNNSMRIFWFDNSTAGTGIWDTNDALWYNASKADDGTSDTFKDANVTFGDVKLIVNGTIYGLDGKAGVRVNQTLNFSFWDGEVTAADNVWTNSTTANNSEDIYFEYTRNLTGLGPGGTYSGGADQQRYDGLTAGYETANNDTLYDIGTGLPNALVTITTNLGSVTQPTAQTPQNGTLTAYVNSTVAGTATINASVGGIALQDGAVVIFQTGTLSVSNSNVTASPNASYVSNHTLYNASNAVRVYVELKDGNNNPMTYQAVHITSNNSADVFTTPVYTNATGVAVATINSTTPHYSLVNASVGGTNINATTVAFVNPQTPTITPALQSLVNASSIWVNGTAVSNATEQRVRVFNNTDNATYGDPLVPFNASISYLSRFNVSIGLALGNNTIYARSEITALGQNFSSTNSTVYTVKRVNSSNLLVLYQGWNFFSVPKKLTTNKDTAGELLAGVSFSSAYSYSPLTNLFTALTANSSISPLEGYWINVNTATNVELTYAAAGGTSPPPTKDIYGPSVAGKGWNAAGFSELTNVPATQALGSVTSWVRLEDWNAASQSYYNSIMNGATGAVNREGGFNGSSPVYPAQGYWLFVTGNATLAGSP